MYVQLSINRFAQNVYVYYTYGWCCSQKVVPFNKEIKNLGSQLAPQKVMANFEFALVQSLELQFQVLRFKAAFFTFFSACGGRSSS